MTMTKYRSLNTIEAVQYTGAPIPGVTCDGHTNEQARMNAGCDSSRIHLPHVHGNTIGGMIVLAPGNWIFPVADGPWGVASDAKFRGSWEVPAEAPTAPPATFPDEIPLAVVPEAPAPGDVTAPTQESIAPVRTTFPTFTD